MLLLSLLIAVLLKQLWGGKNPLHHDTWLAVYQAMIQRFLRRLHLQGNDFEFAIALGLSSCFIVGVGQLLNNYSPFAFMLFAALVLLYSFGRGEFTRHVSAYIVAMAKQDWIQAKHAANSLDCHCDALQENAWSQLNQRFLKQCNYVGFERFFAVVFWFVLVGPVGAFAYRFTTLWLTHADKNAENSRYTKTNNNDPLSPDTPKMQLEKNNHVRHWLWLIEWPAVRLLGLSYAITGNFSSCMHAWKAIALRKKVPSDEALIHILLGALTVDEKLPANQEVARRELEALTQLQARTLWCWLAIIAVVLSL